MRSLANLDCFFLAGEFDSRLKGTFFENFYDYDNGLFRLRLSKESVLVDLAGFAFVSSDNVFPSPPQQPSSFAMLLRKRLSSSKLESVKQLAFDRIFEFSFSSGKGRHFLVAELFGKQGNLLLLDEKRKIIQPFRKAAYSVRSLAGGEDYVLPPNERKHPSELEAEDFEGGKGKIVSFLSKKTSLAPFYLEEACVRAEISLDAKVEGLEKRQKERLVEELHSLLDEKPFPELFFEGGVPFEFSSLKLRKLGGLREHFDSLSKALEAGYFNAGKPVLAVKGDKLEFQLQSQEKALEEFDFKENEAQAAGKWVFENSSAVEELLVLARKHDDKALEKLASKIGFKAKTEGSKLVLEK
ncbi:MAG TPA: NFACT family protein [Candidatus Norongarragalinales archaeon]|nr:NFACT family protein [Candidatus Norongarragalinales archaeon]